MKPIWEIHFAGFYLEIGKGYPWPMTMRADVLCPSFIVFLLLLPIFALGQACWWVERRVFWRDGE